MIQDETNFLSNFEAQNPQAKLLIDGNNVIIESPFSYSDSQLEFDKNDQDFIDILNKVAFRQQFDAIFHHDENLIEFIYGYILVNDDSEKYKEREFDFIFEGQNHKCYFKEPTITLLEISKKFKTLPSEEGVSAGFQLRVFRDSQRLEELPERIKNFYRNRTPLSFFVKPKNEINSINIEKLSRHINFLMTYFDRRSPIIKIRTKETDSEDVEEVRPKRFIQDIFPKNITIKEIDEVTLKLLEVARGKDPRFAFLYYYQIIEYAGFHFIDSKSKSSILKLLREPAIIDNLHTKIGDIFSILSDASQNDDVRMQKVIEEVCDPRLLWKEIENNKDFFSKDLEFIGGFKLEALISKDLSENGWDKLWKPKVYYHLTKIRNCLVHARERRESKVILPDKENDILIKQYIPLIRRISEQIAIAGIDVY